MAKGKYTRRRQAKGAVPLPRGRPGAAVREEAQAAPPAPRLEDRPPEREGSTQEQALRGRGTALGTAVLLAASTALAGLLVSGWTPGPTGSGSSAPTGAATEAVTRVPVEPPPAERPPPRRRAAAAPKTPPRSPAAELFADSCGVCHTLAAAATSGLGGPDLDRLRPTEAQVLRAIRNGGRGTGVMPPDILVGRQAEQVAEFVARATRH